MSHPVMDNDPLSSNFSRLKNRTRVIKACDKCRILKIKCSGTYPCESCSKHNKSCHYSTNPSIRRQTPQAEDGMFSKGEMKSSTEPQIQNQNQPMFAPSMQPSVQPPANMISVPYSNIQPTFSDRLPPLSVGNTTNGNSESTNNDQRLYISYLESRIHQLESQISQGNKRRRKSEMIDLSTNGIPNQSQKHDLSVKQNRGKYSLSKVRYSPRYHIELCKLLNKNTYNDLSDKDRTEAEVPRVQYYGWNLSGSKYLSINALPKMPSIQLPEPIEFYIDYFFKEINPMFAIIHDSVFIEQFNDFQKLNSNSKLFEAMLYLIVCLSIRFTEMQKSDLSNLNSLITEEIIFKHCYTIVSSLSFQWISFELVQSWLLITLYLRICHRQSSTYAALGQAVTMAKSLGLPYNYARFKQGEQNYDTLRFTRIFWSVFILEKTFGLQSGKANLLAQDEIEVDYPNFDISLKSSIDDWITLPSLAMIQICKASYFIQKERIYILEESDYDNVNQEIDRIDLWLHDNGFPNEEIFHHNLDISPLIKAQVRIHYYDLVLNINSKSLFSLLTKNKQNGGQKSRVMDAAIKVINIFQQINQAHLLYVPWYTTLLTMFTVGISLLVLISQGNYLKQAVTSYRQLIEVMMVLERAQVKHGDKSEPAKRFKMVSECIWALKATNNMITRKWKLSINELETIGVNNITSEVNKPHFTVYEKLDDGNGDIQPKPEDTNDDFNTLNDIIDLTGLGQDFSEDLYDNLLWFNKWLSAEPMT